MRFTKTERLCKRQTIHLLFDKGNVFFVGNFKVLWMWVEQPQDVPLQVCVSVPKRYFKHAVDRNLIKRRIREAYRRNKSIFYQHIACYDDVYIAMVVVYRGEKILSYIDIETALQNIFYILRDRINFAVPTF